MAATPIPSLVIREGASGPFYEAKFRWEGQQVKRRLGPAWVRIGRGGLNQFPQGACPCWFTAGWHWAGMWFERADGAGAAPALTLDVLDPSDPARAWLHFDGR